MIFLLARLLGAHGLKAGIQQIKQHRQYQCHAPMHISCAKIDTDSTLGYIVRQRTHYQEGQISHRSCEHNSAPGMIRQDHVKDQKVYGFPAGVYFKICT